MRSCPQCGSVFDSRFCPDCGHGAPITTPVHRIRIDSPEESDQVCHQCRSAIPVGAIKCPHCQGSVGWVANVQALMLLAVAVAAVLAWWSC